MSANAKVYVGFVVFTVYRPACFQWWGYVILMYLTQNITVIWAGEPMMTLFVRSVVLKWKCIYQCLTSFSYFLIFWWHPQAFSEFGQVLDVRWFLLNAMGLWSTTWPLQFLCVWWMNFFKVCRYAWSRIWSLSGIWFCDLWNCSGVACCLFCYVPINWDVSHLLCIRKPKMLFRIWMIKNWMEEEWE
jgi:hypothetical protein